VLVVDRSNSRIQLLSPTLTYLGDIEIPGHQATQMYALHSDELNHRLYIGSIMILDVCLYLVYNSKQYRHDINLHYRHDINLRPTTSHHTCWLLNKLNHINLIVNLIIAQLIDKYYIMITNKNCLGIWRKTYKGKSEGDWRVGPTQKRCLIILFRHKTF